MKFASKRLPKRFTLCLAANLLYAAPCWADADSSTHIGASTELRTTYSGAEIYQHYCQACHMADGKGAQGAGYFPALAQNNKLAAAGYPIFVVLNGLGGMPWFNGMLQDEEIAAVVNYIRSNFGNSFTEPATAQDVAMMRGPVPKE